MKFKKSISTALATLLFSSSVVAVSADDNHSFKDVQKADWYYQSIQKLSTKDIINGFSDGTFKPQNAVTRAQAATIIANALKLDLSNVKDPGFKDVNKNSNHYKAIAALTELGVFNKGKQFNPSDTLTRKQMAKILVEAFDLQTNQLKNFRDVKKTSWEYKYVGILGALGISKNEQHFNPADKVTRAHLVAFIERTIDHKRSDDDLDDLWDDWDDWDDYFDDRFDDLDDRFDDQDDNRDDRDDDSDDLDDRFDDQDDNDSDDDWDDRDDNDDDDDRDDD